MANHIFSNVGGNPFGRVHACSKLDEKRKLIHLLDCHGPTSLTNSVPLILQKVLDDLEISGELTEWTWLLYGTDDSVFQYDPRRPFDGSGFKYVASSIEEGDLADAEFFYKMKTLSIVFSSHSQYTLVSRMNSFSGEEYKKLERQSSF